LRHPVEFYSRFLSDYGLGFCGNNSGLIEAAWHVILSEPLKAPSRDDDTRIPLALKFDVPTKFSDNVI